MQIINKLNMFNFGEKEEKNNKTEKQDDNLGKALRNKIVKNVIYNILL